LQFWVITQKSFNKNRNLTWDKNDQHSKIYLLTDDGRRTPSDGNTSLDPLGQVSKKVFEDINRVIIIHKSKDRQHQKKKNLNQTWPESSLGDSL
jgi:hypothetical protein